MVRGDLLKVKCIALRMYYMRQFALAHSYQINRWKIFSQILLIERLQYARVTYKSHKKKAPPKLTWMTPFR